MSKDLPRHAGRASVVVVCALVIVAVATWAAVIGPDHVLRGEGVDGRPGDHKAPPPSVEFTDAPVAEPDEPPTGGGSLPAAVGVSVAIGLGLVLVLGLGAWIVILRSSSGPRGRRRSPGDQAELDAPSSPSARTIAAALAQDAPLQLELLRQGTPRNAIVACWQRFESLTATVGLARERWETSSEHALRVLLTAGADARAVVLLEDAFREARFSEHELDEAARARAIDLLDTVHRSLVDAGAAT